MVFKKIKQKLSGKNKLRMLEDPYIRVYFETTYELFFRGYDPKTRIFDYSKALEYEFPPDDP